MKRTILAAMTAVLVVACDATVPTAVPSTTASFTASPTDALLDASVAVAGSKINVSALIDGRSRLILRGNTAQWNHFDFAAPGLWSGRNEPTIINGKEWFPKWPGQSGEVRCGGCFSDVFTGVNPALPSAPVVIGVVGIVARVAVAIIQQPAPNNDYTAIIEFNDNGPFGGDRYRVDVTFTYAPPVAKAGGPYGGSEGDAVEFDGSASFAADGGALTYAWDFGDGTTSTDAKPTHSYADNGTYAVTLTVIDGGGLSSAATTASVIKNVAPSVTSLALPTAPVPIGAAVAVAAHFTDPGTRDTHDAQIDWGDGASSAATVASGSANGSHAYAAAGVYTVSVVVTDDDGSSDTRSSATELTAYVVVYDPAAGFVTGGGWITSPVGAYAADPALTGRASFGFVAKYHKGATTPSGNTEFEFKAGRLNFKATSYEWLVVAGSKAKYKGEGTINGAGQYGFMLTAIDGGDGADAFRIKIWDLAGGAVVYDNKMSAVDDSDDATAIGGGNITIHN